jgi:hypothetical protein
VADKKSTLYEQETQMNRILALAGFGLVAALLSAGSAEALDIGGPTSEWVPITYPGTSPDPFADQQTGHAEADIVGSDTVPAIYTQYDDNGTVGDTSDDLIAFRFRMSRESSPSGYSTSAIIGINAYPDLTASADPMDLYIVLNTSGSGDSVQLYDPGNKANISPNTTNTSAIRSTEVATNSTNYDWSPVSAINCDADCLFGDPDFDVDGPGDGSETDYFLSFSYSLQAIIDELVANGVGSVDETTPLSYVFGTSTQVNAYNQDLGGVDDDTADMSQTWSQLGVLSDAFTATGILVPEPSTGVLLLAGLVALGQRERRKRTTRR